LAGEEITDILVEDFNRIFVEKAGRLERVALRFSDPQTYQIYIEKLLHQANQTLDESKPFANFLLPGGARVHLAGGSITGGSFYLSIRRPSSKVWDLADLSQKGMFSNALRFTIQSLLKQKLNILISGATGSGKTSLLRSLLMEITASERLIIMEDVPELRIGRSNAAYLNTRQEVGSDLPEIGLRELIRQSLRMRPDRLVLGEVRGPEALDLLLAMNTGHQGCLGTLHANNARDALWRLQCLIRLGSGEIQESTAQELIHRNIHVIIHCQKDSQGVRQIKEIAYMRGIESGCYLLEYHSEDAPSCEAQRFCA
jgi:pilus assembly protein CpaF